MQITTETDYLALALDKENKYYVRANAILKLNPIKHAEELRVLSGDEDPSVRLSAIRIMDTESEKHWIEQTYAFDDDFDVRLCARRKLKKIGVFLPKEKFPM